MPRNDLRDDLADGVGVAALPIMGPNGAPVLEALADLPPDPPRLCAAGPCRRYHRFTVQLEAQDPLAERRPDGQLVAHGRSFHTEQHHYCYPEAGIETRLGSLPVFQCSRWEPEKPWYRSKASLLADYERKLDAWRAEHASGELEPPPPLPKGDNLITITVLSMRDGVVAQRVVREFTPAATITEVNDCANEFTPWAASAVLRTVSIRGAATGAPTIPIRNYQATLDELGLDSGSTIAFDFKEIQ